MSVMHLSLPSGKAEFNFQEAAALLGLTSGELEALVAEHLAEEGSEKILSRMRFRPADLIMLNMMQSAAMPRISAG